LRFEIGKNLLAKEDELGHTIWKVSELNAIQSALTQAAARRRWLRAWNGLWRGLFAGAVIWLLALGIFKLAPIPSAILTWAGGLGALLTVGGFLYGWYHKPTLQQTARWLDNDQHLQERLSTALELGQGPGNESWRALLMADAARYATKLDPRKLIPIRLPAITRWAFLALVVSVGLGFLPEYRTQAYLQKKQDQQAVKTAGKILLDITKRNLERHDPLLPPVEKSLQAVQELGLKMDKVALTRSDALKDLANVSEKVKSEQKELGRNPLLKSLEKSGREAGSRGTMASAAEKQMEALEKELGKSAENPEAVEKLAAELAKAQKALANMPQGDSPAAQTARQEMAQALSSIAQQAKEMGQQLPDLDAAIAALQNSQMETFRRDMDAATMDLNKLKETAQALQKLQQQGEETGKDLPEQLKRGQSDAAQASLQKMVDQLKSGKMTPDEAAKLLDEVARSVDPASPYGKASQFLKQAAQQMKADQKADAAESLAAAAKELDKVAAEMADAKALEGTLAALQKAEDCLGNARGKGKAGSSNPKLKAGTGQNGGVGGWTPDDSQLYPEMSASWDNTGIKRPDTAPRGQTDRGDMQLADDLNPTKFKGQLQPGGPMPSINLKGVSIKGQSTVEYQQAAAAAQSDAQSALNQDQVPRAYQGAVKSYFDDIKQ
jgi:hypothetical protein